MRAQARVLVQVRAQVRARAQARVLVEVEVREQGRTGGGRRSLSVRGTLYSEVFRPDSEHRFYSVQLYSI